MRARRRHLYLVIVFISSAGVAAAGDNVGTTTAPFLKLGAGARAIAMGEAVTAGSTDATALYWNPAGMTAVEKQSIALMHTAYLDSSAYEYASYVRRLAGGAAVGAGLQYFSVGDITQTDTSGNTVGSLKPNDLALSIGYARGVGVYSVGLSAKYIRSKLADAASTWAVDVGAMSPPMFRDRLRGGISVRNLGGKLKFDSESEELPLSVRAGAEATLLPAWRTELDFEFPKDNTAFILLGTEYQFMREGPWGAALRAGYNGRTGSDINGTNGFSVGTGIHFNRVSVDYGFLPFGDLGGTHHISLIIN